MGDLDDNQLQPILQNIADDTVVPLSADNQGKSTKQQSMYDEQP